MEIQQEFLKIEKKLLSAFSVTNKKTGVSENLSPTDKILYRYMFDRYKFFNSQKQQYFDNQSDIADACGMAIATLQRALYGLVNVGLVDIKTVVMGRCGGRVKNFYTVMDVLNDNFVLSKTRVKPAKKITQSKKDGSTVSVESKVIEKLPQKQVVTVGYDVDDGDEPF